MKSIFSIGVKLDHFRDSYLGSLDTQLCSLALATKYPLMERKATTSVKYITNEYVRVKKVIKIRPNLPLDEIISRPKIVRIEDSKNA